MANRQAIEQRLTGYWKLEALNIALIPFGAWLIARINGWALGPASFAAFVPVCFLLAIGAQYWRAKLIRLRSGAALPPAIGLLARLQAPALALMLAAAAFTAAAFAVPDIARSPADRWMALVMTALGVLEYVNYYHRQLQHFDHAPDFLRLITGRGLRRSQMSRDLARWRAGLR